VSSENEPEREREKQKRKEKGRESGGVEELSRNPVERGRNG
jgi:hypothetical protein